jgi:hypothetical protein
MLLAGVEVVPNDVLLDVGAALVISGPNAGGKTVALKTVGDLAVLMAQAGLRLPTARPAMVPLYREIVTDVGDDQSILANLSTFSAHMRHVIEGWRRRREDGAGTLVLLDEIAVGTDPGQGAALAEAILLHLSAARGDGGDDDALRAAEAAGWGAAGALRERGGGLRSRADAADVSPDCWGCRGLRARSRWRGAWGCRSALLRYASVAAGDERRRRSTRCCAGEP